MFLYLMFFWSEEESKPQAAEKAGKSEATEAKTETAPSS
jgi:hypothetical protein